MIYLDNAATSFPKPAGVSDRMKYYLDCIGAPVNRSVYGPAQEAAITVLLLRERLARLFRFPGDLSHVLLTAGATAALNQAICGFLHSGDHVLVSAMEHNAVMRPLQRLPGVTFDRIPCSREGILDPAAIEPLIRPNTRLCVIAHGSNVCGTVQNAEAIGEVCAAHGIPFVLDAAQTAGHYPVDFQKFRLSALAVPGHKGLLGPSGIGALLVREDFAAKLTPILAGGTGSASNSELLPDYLPDRFESGTQNLPGIFGWERALQFIEETGVEALRRHEVGLMALFLRELEGVPGICGTRNPAHCTGVLSVDFVGQDNAEMAVLLEERYGILTRCGLHCAPSAHKTLGTFPGGTVRFSLGFANTEDDVLAAASAIREISRL